MYRCRTRGTDNTVIGGQRLFLGRGPVCALIVAGAACAAPNSTVAGASPSPQSSRAGTGPLVTATVLGQGTATEKLAITTAGASDVVVQQVTIQPGGRTGWHTHAGKVLAVVKAGTLTSYTDPAGSPLKTNATAPACGR
jgi:hypothetical protein